MTFFFAGCRGSPTENKNVVTEKILRRLRKIKFQIKKFLVAYFSRADENYRVGNIIKGNTKIIAEMIADKIDDNLFEIQPVKNYSVDYTECTEVAKVEIQQKARPE